MFWKAGLPLGCLGDLSQAFMLALLLASVSSPGLQLLVAPVCVAEGLGGGALKQLKGMPLGGCHLPFREPLLSAAGTVGTLAGRTPQ